MKINKFDIHNFKGISKATIHLADETPGNICTLIGLNESGKTTILEAISHFVTEDTDTSSLVETVHQKASMQDLIPKDKKAAFTGSVIIKALVSLEVDDVSALGKMFQDKYGMDLEKSTLPETFVVEKVYLYEDSTFKNTVSHWYISFNLKSHKARKFKLCTGKPGETPDLKKIWLSGIGVLKDRLPKIVYFPTFLFNFPDRIYLEGEDSETNSYYKQVIQDVLDSHGEGLNIQKHIVDRISRLRENSAANFLAIIFGSPEKGQIDAVLQSASNEMSKIIFGSWNKILGKNVKDKRVQIDWYPDSDKANAPYLEVSIVDGQAKYSLSERSLGFRWFFSFLLFTQFRKNRKNEGGTVFLFDEPAANLHSKAQIKLLESFSRIGNNRTYIIYSTHSHYMVNPLWLEKAYIVENKATDYDNEDDVDSFAIRKTDIKAIKYKNFVGSYPSKTTYFQPVLDALDVSFSPLITSANALIIEGKNDYHPFVYFKQKLKKDGFPTIFPGQGAGHSATLISLFRGWGVRFRIVLDDDSAGRTAKKKYKDEFFLKDNEVVTLGDISTILKNKEFEGIYMNDVKNAVNLSFSVSEPTKRQYSLYFQGLLASEATQDFPETEGAFQPLFDWIDTEFAS